MWCTSWLWASTRMRSAASCWIWRTTKKSFGGLLATQDSIRCGYHIDNGANKKEWRLKNIFYNTRIHQNDLKHTCFQIYICYNFSFLDSGLFISIQEYPTERQRNSSQRKCCTREQGNFQNPHRSWYQPLRADILFCGQQLWFIILYHNWEKQLLNTCCSWTPKYVLGF